MHVPFRVTVPLVAGILVVSGMVAHASTGLRWSEQQLAQLSEVIVTGRVSHIVSDWDPAVDTLYTYITVDVSQVLKGTVSASRIVVKQMGGTAGDVTLHVFGQPDFTLGEDVLLFLEVRPRDQTLYTTALWQGKWRLAADRPAGVVAIRRVPSHDADPVQEERVAIGVMRQAIAAAEPASIRSTMPIETRPIEAPLWQRSLPFTLLNPATPFRWNGSPIPVDVQMGGQPGLAGGGFAEIQQAIGLWNAAGTSLRFSPGQSNIPARCFRNPQHPLGNNRVSVAFMDPCQEMSNAGGTAAIGGAYATANGGQTVSGIAFQRAVSGFVVNNDGGLGHTVLLNNNCFLGVELHELGHVLGLDHTTVPGSIMLASININACRTNVPALGTDDMAGAQFIYPAGGGAPGPGGAPGNVQAVVTNNVLTVTWTAPTTGGTPAFYVLEFAMAQGGAAFLIAQSQTTSFTTPLPPGTPAGTYWVRVYAQFATPGPMSPDVSFTLGGGAGPGPCQAAPVAPTGLTFTLTGNTLVLSWNPSQGATSYVLQAGSTSGGTNLFNANVGGTPGLTGTVPGGVTIFARVLAVNACGTSGPSNEISFTAGGGGGGFNVNGTWRGMTDQGFAMGFTVVNNRVTAIDFRGRGQGTNGCVMTAISQVTGLTVPIAGNAFSYHHVAVPGQVQYIIAAEFLSPTVVQGRITFAQVPLPNTTPCNVVPATIFSATKQ